MGCPPVCGDNPQALASGLTYIQMDKHGITFLYHLHQCRPCTSQDILCLSWLGWYNFTHDFDVSYVVQSTFSLESLPQNAKFGRI